MTRDRICENYKVLLSKLTRQLSAVCFLPGAGPSSSEMGQYWETCGTYILFIRQIISLCRTCHYRTLTNTNSLKKLQEDPEWVISIWLSIAVHLLNLFIWFSCCVYFTYHFYEDHTIITSAVPEQLGQGEKCFINEVSGSDTIIHTGCIYMCFTAEQTK